MGRVTLPGEAGYEKQTATLMERWGADAVRNSDGTSLPKGIKALGATVYSTLCLIRADQEYAYAHKEFAHHRVLMSAPKLAGSDPVKIGLLDGFFDRQFEVDWEDNPKQWWEVIDRTTGKTLPSDDWTYDAESGTVQLEHPEEGHTYTVNFFVRQIWEPTSMYNHLTNGWTCRESMGIDPHFPEAGDHLFQWLEKWLEDNPDTDVVRLTSLFYHFTITGGADGSPLHTDWFGYHDAVSPYALKLFEKEYGYRPRLEDFIDGGSYNGNQCIPTETVRDWMQFVQDFVRDYSKRINGAIHKAQKTSMLFFGDHWIGSEPYVAGFEEVGFDWVVGSVTCGEDLRRIADIPGGVNKEIRMQPYFFPDLFDGQHDTAGIAKQMWVAARRALLRNPCIDRIGYGGYISLAVKEDAFVKAVEDICNEFRELADAIGGEKPYTVARVGILNAWGRCRSWMTGPRWYEKLNGRGLSEALSGLPFAVSFIDFDDVKHGALEQIDVLINEGRAGSSWSGGSLWQDLAVQQIIREWVKEGGGLLGIGEPFAYDASGRFFQLADLLGVDKETGRTLNSKAAVGVKGADHFLSGLQVEVMESSVFPVSGNVQILAEHKGQVMLSANEIGRGRAVYSARTGSGAESYHCVYRMILWLCKKEAELKRAGSDNPHVDVAFFEGSKIGYALNSSPRPQQAVIYDLDGNARDVTLPGFGLKEL